MQESSQSKRSEQELIKDPDTMIRDAKKEMCQEIADIIDMIENLEKGFSKFHVSLLNDKDKLLYEFELKSFSKDTARKGLLKQLNDSLKTLEIQFKLLKDR